MNGVFTVIDVGWLVIKCNAPASEKVQRTFGFRIHHLIFPFCGYLFPLSASHQNSGGIRDRHPTRLATEANAPVSRQL
ncbi:MAG: hypothetical protein K0B14_16330 [Anaerolineaceae bacterium]|nr:hypothetical protein [Anaerolineaceae bacterium]